MFKLPHGEDLEYKEKEFFITLSEQFQNSSKIPFYVLAVLLVLALPLYLLVSQKTSDYLIGRYEAPVVYENPYHPEDFKILKIETMRAGLGVYSIYAQILNPNPEISARAFDYRFNILDDSRQILQQVSGTSYILAGESKFLLAPVVKSAKPPARAELEFGQVAWTKRMPQVTVRLEVLQKNTGSTLDGDFFVEGLIKNPHSFGLKKVDVAALIFDAANKNPVALNTTVLNSIKPYENRYFRMIWPTGREKFLPATLGQLQIIPSINLLDPGLVLEGGEKVPAR